MSKSLPCQSSDAFPEARVSHHINNPHERSKSKTTHAQRSSRAGDVRICLISGAPASVRLNSISFAPCHVSQCGVISAMSNLAFGVSAIANFR